MPNERMGEEEEEDAADAAATLVPARLSDDAAAAAPDRREGARRGVAEDNMTTRVATAREANKRNRVQDDLAADFSWRDHACLRSCSLWLKSRAAEDRGVGCVSAPRRNSNSSQCSFQRKCCHLAATSAAED